MGRHESFIDSIVDGVLKPQPFLTPVMGNDCCKEVWVICTKEWEAAFFHTYRLITAKAWVQLS